MTFAVDGIYNEKMRQSRLSRQFLACALGCACAATAAPLLAAEEKNPEAPAVAWPLDPKVIAETRADFMAKARDSFLDKTGKTPPPAADFPFPDNFAEAFAQDIAALKSLAAQLAYVELGRGPEDLSTYADMIAHVAAHLGINPPEPALLIYRDRVRPPDQPLTPRQEQGFSELTATVRDPAFQHRYLYVPDIYGRSAPVPGAPRAPQAASRGTKRRRRRTTVAPPPEPQGPPQSVLEAIDWERADALAAAAESGANGWNRRTRRRRRGRCYEWVRMALQKTGLWTDDYRSEVTHKGDARRPRRAYSFAWAMNQLEARWQKDPFAGRQAPLRRLDLRVDPLVKGSIVVFDRNVCGFNAKSGHIEVISSIEPLRASSYKFHQIKLDCLAKAADAGQVHVYVPQRLDPYPPAAAEPPTAPDAPPATAESPSPVKPE